MSNEIIIENEKLKQPNKKQLIFAILGLIVSVVVIVIGILYVCNIIQRNIAIHVIYPGIALNCLFNGFSMWANNNKKIAKIDFITSGFIAVVYIIIAILSFI